MEIPPLGFERKLSPIGDVSRKWHSRINLAHIGICADLMYARFIEDSYT